MRSSVEPQLLYEYPGGHEPGSGGKVYPEPVFQIRRIPLLTLSGNPAGILIEEERIVMIMRKCWEQYGTVLFLFVSEKNKNKKNPSYYN